MTQRDAVDILELYKTKLHKIPKGSIPGICESYLPTYIISDNDQILKLRRKMKVLQIPEFMPLSKEDKFSRVLLYFPLRRGENINMDRIGEKFLEVFHLSISLVSDDLYYARDSCGMKDSNGVTLTIIQVNERKMFPRKLCSPD